MNDREQKIFDFIKNDGLNSLPGYDSAFERDEITLEATFEDLGVDSLAVVELTMAIEKQFRLEINDIEAEEVQTVGDLVDLAMRSR